MKIEGKEKLSQAHRLVFFYSLVGHKNHGQLCIMYESGTSCSARKKEVLKTKKQN